MVERPLIFTVAEIKRLPAVSRIYFLECSGNGRAAWQQPRPEMSPQQVDGMTSNTEWTGVPLATLFREVGIDPDAAWFLAEGGDGCKLARSIPVSKGMDDALVAWGQNGEPLRPEQGFPIRLLLPGYEGSANVKWLRRIELGREPWMTRWETATYTDPLPNGTARQFSLVMDAKSIITSPAHPEVLPARGWHPIRGLAWSGRGRITRVDVSTDGGRTWSQAVLQAPVLSKAHTRFSLMWEWRGEEALLLSRAVDETGYVQPTRKALLAARGLGTSYHFNPIRGWRVTREGRVFFEAET
jgi:sulfane dehydrogenase subunit SoxC